MQENQIKVGDLVICEDTLFVTKEEQRAGIVLSVWCEFEKHGDCDGGYEMCTVQHPGFRSLWQTRFLKVLASAESSQETSTEIFSNAS
jgi:UDP-N-acetylglucosamine enolpyruvyl transferase